MILLETLPNVGDATPIWSIVTQLATILAAAVAVYVGIIRPWLRRHDEQRRNEIRQIVAEVREVKHQVEDNGHRNTPPTLRDDLASLRGEVRRHARQPAHLAHRPYPEREDYS